MEARHGLPAAHASQMMAHGMARARCLFLFQRCRRAKQGLCRRACFVWCLMRLRALSRNLSRVGSAAALLHSLEAAAGVGMLQLKPWVREGAHPDGGTILVETELVLTRPPCRDGGAVLNST